MDLPPAWRQNPTQVQTFSLLRRGEPAIIVDSARCIVLLLWLDHVPDVSHLMSLLSENAIQVDNRTLLFRWIDPQTLSPALIPWVVWLFRGAIVLCALGLLTRISALVAALSYNLLWSTQYVFGHAGHPRHRRYVKHREAFCQNIRRKITPEPSKIALELWHFVAGEDDPRWTRVYECQR